MIKSQFWKMHTEDMPVNYYTLIKNEVNLIVKQRKQQGNNQKGKKLCQQLKNLKECMVEERRRVKLILEVQKQV